MILLNINERKWYIHEEEFAEDVINKMFKEYFDELYQEEAAKWRIDEIWGKILLKIPKRAVFVEKDSILYSVNSDLKFEVVPEDFFELDEICHPVLIECFKKCYSKFKKMMKNYREWNGEEDRSLIKKGSIANVYLETSNNYVPNIECLSTTLSNAKCKFGQILYVSLRKKMCNQMCPKIVNVYKSALLQTNPIMLITKKDCRTRKIYAVQDNLEVKEVTYSLIERELEEIIHEIIPEDTDFLVNRIYNFMMLPLSNVKPCIRINKVQDTGLNATLFLEEKDIPVVCDYKLKSFYTFLKITHDEGFPTNRLIRYQNNRICVWPMEPRRGMEKIQHVNKNMFDEMSCYVENAGETYKKYYRSYNYSKIEEDTEHNMLYKLRNGRIQEVYKHQTINKESPEYEKFEKIIEEEGEKANNQGTYAFWEITFEENE